MTKNCYLCDQPATVDKIYVMCPEYKCSNCDIKYKIQHETEINALLEIHKNDIIKNQYNIRGYINEENINKKETFKITKDNIKHLISLNDLKVNEKLKKLLVFFYKKAEIGEILHVEVNTDKIPKLKLNNNEEINLIPIVWGKDHKEILALIDMLISLDRLKKHDVKSVSIDKRKVAITAKGFEYIEKSENIVSDMGFCAMWFTNKMTEIWESVIEPTIKIVGYSPQRIDIHDHNNVILEEIEGLIKQSKFMIADLTGHRGGVYFEAGLAKSLQKPIIYTCEDCCFDDRHFDIQHFNCLKWNRENLDDFRKALQNRIENTVGKGAYYKEKY